MRLILEGPTGPHIQMELPPATESELDPLTSDNAGDQPDSVLDIDELDNDLQPQVAKIAYIN